MKEVCDPTWRVLFDRWPKGGQAVRRDLLEKLTESQATTIDKARDLARLYTRPAPSCGEVGELCVDAIAHRWGQHPPVALPRPPAFDPVARDDVVLTRRRVEEVIKQPQVYEDRLETCLAISPKIPAFACLDGVPALLEMAKLLKQHPNLVLHI